MSKIKKPLIVSNCHRYHNDHRNNNKKGTHHIPGVCMAIAILLERNREMCGIQSLLPLILFQSHAQKRVCMQSYYTVEPKSFT